MTKTFYEVVALWRLTVKLEMLVRMLIRMLIRTKATMTSADAACLTTLVIHIAAQFKHQIDVRRVLGC